MGNGRRMTSNPVSAFLHPEVEVLTAVQTQLPPAVNGYNGQTNLPNGFDNGSGYFVPGHPGSAATNVPAPPLTQPQPPRPSSTASSTSYPWSTRVLRLHATQTSSPTAPQSPFPRYGLSVPAFPSHSGHMLIFGGLVHETVRNDMWSIDVREYATMPVKTKGDAPKPRVGHASAMADRIMLVWGGDTKVKPDDPQDESLYILDLRE